MIDLVEAILAEDIPGITRALRYVQDINEMDRYGFTPLIESAIVNRPDIAEILLSHGANPNGQDVTGGSALHWACENNNIEFCRLLLKYQANPNLYNNAGQVPLVMPILREHHALKKIMIQGGADLEMAQGFIQAKMSGHIFELIGNTSILAQDRTWIDVDFEGFFLEVTLGLISHSLLDFQRHFAARQWRGYSGVTQWISTVLDHAFELMRYQQYQVKREKYYDRIIELLSEELVLIPVGYEGHAITLVKYKNILIKCDRREDDRLHHPVAIYQITKPEKMSPKHLASLIYQKQSDEFINEELNHIWGLKLWTDLPVEMQMSGNCSWANVEAAVPALFFLILYHFSGAQVDVEDCKANAIKFFHRFRNFNKDRQLQFCLQRFDQGNLKQKLIQGEMLAAILFNEVTYGTQTNLDRVASIMKRLHKPPFDYLLKNYLRVYDKDRMGGVSKPFAQLLKDWQVGFKSG